MYTTVFDIEGSTYKQINQTFCDPGTDHEYVALCVSWLIFLKSWICPDQIL